MTPIQLLHARERLGLTQSQLATLLGFTRYSTICDYERGAKPIPAIVKRHISIILDMPEPRRKKYVALWLKTQLPTVSQS